LILRVPPQHAVGFGQEREYRIAIRVSALGFSAILLLPLPHLRNNHFIYRYLLVTRRFLLDFIEPLNIGLSP
jgi:hypothetical protein